MFARASAGVADGVAYPLRSVASPARRFCPTAHGRTTGYLAASFGGELGSAGVPAEGGGFGLGELAGLTHWCAG